MAASPGAALLVRPFTAAASVAILPAAVLWIGATTPLGLFAGSPFRAGLTGLGYSLYRGGPISEIASSIAGILFN